MVVETAIASGVVTACKLAKEIYDYVEACKHANAEAHDLATSYQFNEARLEKLVKFFSDRRVEKYLDEKLAIAVDNVCKDMVASLEKTSREIHARDPKRDSTGINTLKWKFVAPALKEGDSVLVGWLSRLSDLLKDLPPELTREASAVLLNPSGRELFFPLAAFADHLDAKKEQEKMELKDRASLLVKCKDSRKKDTKYWIDTIHVPEDLCHKAKENQYTDFKLEVAKLAQFLGSAESSDSCVPRAHCWYEVCDVGQLAKVFEIAYRIPESIWIDETGPVWTTNPDGATEITLPNYTYTLKDIVRQTPKHSLETRVSLAAQVARAATYMHALKWVHKSLRPDNILLLFENGQQFAEDGGLGRVMLKGFDLARRGTPDTKSTGTGIEDEARDNAWRWEAQVYLHPKRQTIFLDEELKIHNSHARKTHHPNLEFYTYKHDIYSLGVILLEIGLWSDVTPADSVMKRKRPQERKEELLKRTESLSVKMGRQFTTIVEACLNVDKSEWTAEMVLDCLHKIRL